MDELKVTSRLNNQKSRNHLVSGKNKDIPNRSFKEALNSFDRKPNRSDVNKNSLDITMIPA